MKIHADLGERVVVRSDDLPWSASPAPGVERRMLERDGGEVARATSLVRFAPGSSFAAHSHGGGEEFLVLDGVFSDEEGDFGRGMYVRNPPGSRHTPRSDPGCTILVKLCQMDPDDRAVVRVDTSRAPWQPGGEPGIARMPLFERGPERVEFVKLEPGARLAAQDHPGGMEFFVFAGACADEQGDHPSGTWVRNPPGRAPDVWSSTGCTLYLKTGHLAPAAGRHAAQA